MYQNSGVCVDAYDVTGQDKNMYYSQIQEIWELDFHGFKIPLFRCNSVDAIKGVVKDKYMFISVDLNHQGYKSEPFVLAKHVAQVFYVPETTNKRFKVVIPEKQWIVRVENPVDEEEFDQFDEIPPFITSMIKPRIPSANKAPYLQNDHNEKVMNFKKPRPHWKVAKWLCKICSMCENLTFIGYLCEICSMCENMAIWCLASISEVCVVSEVLCSVFDGYCTESSNVFSFWWRKRRHTLLTHVSHPKKRETRLYYARLLSQEKETRDMGARLPFRHVQRAAWEASRGAQAAFNLWSLLTSVCLKAGEHEF
jgi:hypothetical protein